MKNFKKIVLLVTLTLVFNACNGGSSDGGGTTTGTLTPVPSSTDTWDQTNISTTPTSTPVEDVVTDTAVDSLGGETSIAQAGAIPFPALPTNIALDPKYIPPQ